MPPNKKKGRVNRMNAPALEMFVGKLKKDKPRDMLLREKDLIFLFTADI